MELSNQINECLAGVTNEVSDAQDRVVAFLVEQRDKAEDSDNWFHPAYSLLFENEKLGNDLDDVVDSIWARIGIEEPDEDQDDLLVDALEQFVDAQ